MSYRKQEINSRPIMVPAVLAPFLEPLLAAVDAGNLAETRRLYEKYFNSDSWEWPSGWDDTDPRGSPFYDEDHYVAFTLFPMCLRQAASRQHWHIVDWIIRDGNADNDWCTKGRPSDSFMEEAVAETLWRRATGSDGTIMHALQMCGKGWWPQDLYEDASRRREAYEERTFFDWDGRGEWFGKLRGAYGVYDPSFLIDRWARHDPSDREFFRAQA